MGNRDKTTSKTISQTYNAFPSMIKHNTLRMRGRWKAEINEKIPDDIKWEMCTKAHQTTNSSTWRVFKWKIISRFYRTPEITDEMGHTHLSSYWRNCGTQSTNHTHIFWLCPKLCVFWRQIFDPMFEFSIFH